MHDFTQNEKDFLRKLGSTGNGRELIILFEKLKYKLDRTSSIPEGSDYGAQVEGRKLTVDFFDKMILTMRTNTKNFVDSETGVDEFS